MKSLFITATNTNVGKTYTTLKLLDYYSDLGYKVGVFKPIETGVFDKPNDAALLLKKASKLNLHFKNFTTDDICPIQLKLPAAPYVSSGLKDIDLDIIFTQAKKLQQFCDILLIEGAGGLLVPINKNYFLIDLLKDLQAYPLLVTHDKLGCINDTLLNLELLNKYDLNYTWCVNVREKKSFSKITLPFYKNYFKGVYTLQEHLPQIAQELITNSHSNRNT